MGQISAVLFDFDGVLSKDRFYQSMFDNYPLLKEHIIANIFNSPDKLGDQWMRGELAVEDINKKLSDGTGIAYDELQDGLITSLKNFKLDVQLLKFAKLLKDNGIQIALVTNNMDIFNQVTIPIHNLESYFPVIINSSDYGFMKHEKEGELFDVALKKLKNAKIEETLLIDDSEKACNMFLNKGGQVHRYTDFTNFHNWIASSVLSDLYN